MKLTDWLLVEVALLIIGLVQSLLTKTGFAALPLWEEINRLPGRQLSHFGVFGSYRSSLFS